MAQSGWLDCPAPVRQQVEDFAAAVRSILVDNLLGIYLHGSLAMGCFNADRSDIDLLIITRQGMDLATKRALGELLLRSSDAPRPIEISFLRQADLRPWQYPTPFDLHYGEDWRGRYETELAGDGWQHWNDMHRTDPDLAAHCTIMLARGICLDGEPIPGVFPPVPRADYVSALLYDVDTAPAWIADNPVYGILNLCRVLWYLTDAQIASKDEGGAWAVEHLPDVHQPLVVQALNIYRGSCEDTAFDPRALAEFALYMDAGIKQLVTSAM